MVSDVVINLTNTLSGIDNHLSLYYVPPTWPSSEKSQRKERNNGRYVKDVHMWNHNTLYPVKGAKSTVIIDR